MITLVGSYTGHHLEVSAVWCCQQWWHRGVLHGGCMGALRMSTPNIKFGYGALLGALAWANGLTTYPPLVRIPLAVGLLVECYRSNASAPPIPRVQLPRNLSGAQIPDEKSQNRWVLKVCKCATLARGRPTAGERRCENEWMVVWRNRFLGRCVSAW